MKLTGYIDSTIITEQSENYCYSSKRFGKAERNALKRIAKDLEYDVVNPNIFREIELAIDEKDASEIMARTRRMIA